MYPFQSQALSHHFEASLELSGSLALHRSPGFLHVPQLQCTSTIPVSKRGTFNNGRLIVLHRNKLLGTNRTLQRKLVVVMGIKLEPQEVFSARSFSTTHFPRVLLDTSRFFIGGPTLDDDNGSSRSLVCPDIATVQPQLCPHTSKIVRLLNVIARTFSQTPPTKGVSLLTPARIGCLHSVDWTTGLTIKI